MNVISEDTMTLEQILSLCRSKQLSAQIVELLPAEPALGLGPDAYLKIDYPDNLSVITWIDTYARCQLRMRVVIIPRDERDRIEDSVLLDWAADLNQQIECLGTVSTRNLLGVTLEYRLPYQDGILEQTVLSAAEQLAQGASWVRKSLRRFL